MSHPCRKSVHVPPACSCLVFFSLLLFLFRVFFVPSFFFSRLRLLFWFSCLLTCRHKCSPANMAHPSNHVRFIPERSRSRDEPMWHHRPPQHRNQHRDAWHEVPPVPRLRKVLIIVDLDAVRPLMNKIHDDVMGSTTCDVLPSLSRNEELALFTYNVLVDTHQLDVQPVVQHQPAHLVHVGSLPVPFLDGSPLAR